MQHIGGEQIFIYILITVNISRKAEDRQSPYICIIYYRIKNICRIINDCHQSFSNGGVDRN